MKYPILTSIAFAISLSAYAQTTSTPEAPAPDNSNSPNYHIGNDTEFDTATSVKNAYGNSNMKASPESPKAKNTKKGTIPTSIIQKKRKTIHTSKSIKSKKVTTIKTEPN